MKNLLLLLLFIFISITNLVAKKYEPPQFEMKEALNIVLKHIENKQITIPKGYILQKSEYINVYNEYKESCWVFRWLKHPRAKGGWFEFRINNSKEIKQIFGK